MGPGDQWRYSPVGGMNGEEDHRRQEQQPHDERVPPPSQIRHEAEGQKGYNDPMSVTPGPWFSMVRLWYEGPESVVEREVDPAGGGTSCEFDRDWRRRNARK